MSAEFPTPREVGQLPLQAELENIRPLSDRVLIRLEPPPAEYHGLIALPQSRQPTGKQAARVLAVGPKVTEFKAGDRVLVEANPGWEIGGDTTARILGEKVILGVLDDGVEVGL